MNDALKILHIVCFSLAGISFCIAIFIFFKFRIVEVVQDLNGTIAKRQIELMRKRNENAKNYAAGLLDAEMAKTGKTGRIDRTGNIGGTGMTVLQANRIVNPEFVITKSIMFINTSELVGK